MRAGEVITQLQTLLWPLSCAGCGKWDVALCDRCAALIYHPLRRVEHLAAPLTGRLAVWARAHACSEVSRIVWQYASGLRTDIHPQIDQAMGDGGDQWWARCASAQDGLAQTHRALMDGNQLVVTPLVPAGRQVRARQVAALAESFTCGITRASNQPRVLVRRLFSQAPLRWPRTANQLQMRSGGLEASTSQVLLLAPSLVDSQLLATASQMLRARHISVVGAIVFAPGVGAGHGQ